MAGEILANLKKDLIVWGCFSLGERLIILEYAAVLHTELFMLYAIEYMHMFVCVYI